MNEDSRRDTIYGLKDKMSLEIKVDEKTNEFLVRITGGFGIVVLDESQARWLEKALVDFLPLEDRLIRPTEGDN